MCGICGLIYFSPEKKVNENLLKPILKRMHHRGPDDSGLFSHNNVGFGFVRLSIIDLSLAGHQPMQSVDGKYTIIYNGEIYNYIELREDLINRGYKFKSNTDTEVLLNLYIEYGESFLSKLNGMFAFAIYNNVNHEVFAARDRYGIKPFYFIETKEFILFGSEINALLKFPNLPSLTINREALYNYFVYNRTDYDDTTFYKEIKKLPHGSFLKYSQGRVKIQRWYRLSDNLKKPFTGVNEFREAFISSVRIRLRSDVPVGACLSGGIDSSTLVSTLEKIFGRNDVHTFSAVYNDNSKANEKQYIDEFIPRLKNMHYTFPNVNSFKDDFEDLIQTHSEPFSTPAIYAQYKVMKLAQGKVVVLLDGQGADEFLAGYDYFYGFYMKELLLKVKLISFFDELFSYRAFQNNNKHIKYLLFFLLPGTLQSKIMHRKKGYLKTEFENIEFENKSFNDLMYSSSTLLESLINHFEYKLEHLLKWEDTNSMRFSLESRVPFLDYRLVEGTLAMNNSYKLKKGITKKILKDAFSDIVPPKILERREKIGFATPADKWFRSSFFKNIVKDILSSEIIKNSEIIDASLAIKLYERHLKGDLNIANEIWKWINFYEWYKKNKQVFK